jgi:hypothetical protein
MTYFSHFLSRSTSLEVQCGTTEYYHQDSVIPNMEITWLLLNNASLTDERDNYNFYRLSGNFGHDLHYIKNEPIGRYILLVEFHIIWNKCGVMSKTWPKTFTTTNI